MCQYFVLCLQRIEAFENDVGYIGGILAVGVHFQTAVIQYVHHHTQFKICQLQTITLFHRFIPSFRLYFIINKRKRKRCERNANKHTTLTNDVLVCFIG